MRYCPYCGYENRQGVLYCEECGRGLYEVAPDGVLATKQLEDSGDGCATRTIVGTTWFGPDCYLVVHIRDASEPIVLPPSRHLVFGRVSRNNLRKPDVDLTPYEALEKGVSHIHAAINWNGDNLTVVDMGSVNGTYLNGERLTANREHTLHDGDEVRFGKLVTHTYFQSSI